MFIGIRARRSVVKKVISALIEGAVIGMAYNFLFPPEGPLLTAPIAASAASVALVLFFQWLEDRRARESRVD
ncbi:MAG: hypothetical protein ABIZ70_10985 [Gemmatimonadales bacterium]